MHRGRNGEREQPGQLTATRRALVTWAGKSAAGAALLAVPGGRWAERAAAQEDGVILTAAASEIGASPGSAFARSAVAEAAAARGAARVQAAAALAEADGDEGAITQGAAAFADADLAEGAVAQSALAAASAASEDDDVDRGGYKAPAKVITPAGRGSGRRGGRGGRAMRAGRGGGGRGRGGRRAQVGSLPSTGIGSMGEGPLTSLFAAASVAAALGAAALRDRAEPEPVVARVAVVDD